jgi:histidine ammonia-lyase
MNANLNVILGVELMCAAQGVEFRAPLKTSPMLQKAMTGIRSRIAPVGEDRYMAGDIEAAAQLVSEGDIARCCDVGALLAGTET